MEKRYEWKNKTTKMLRMLRNSRTMKEKHGWSRNSGAGFVSEDIKEVTLLPDKKIQIDFHWPHTQIFETGDLNLRETDELISYLTNDYFVRYEQMMRKAYGDKERGRPAR